MPIIRFFPRACHLPSGLDKLIQLLSGNFRRQQWSPTWHSVSGRLLTLQSPAAPGSLFLASRPIPSTPPLICQVLFYTHQHPSKYPSVSQEDSQGRRRRVLLYPLSDTKCFLSGIWLVCLPTLCPSHLVQGHQFQKQRCWETPCLLCPTARGWSRLSSSSTGSLLLWPVPRPLSLVLLLSQPSPPTCPLCTHKFLPS